MKISPTVCPRGCRRLRLEIDSPRGLMPSSSKTALFSALVAFVVHFNSVFNGVVWDDRAALTTNPDAIQARALRELWVHDFWGQDISASDSHKSYRPLAVLSLRLNHQLHGLAPWGYHLGNVVLNSVCCYLFSVLAGLILTKYWHGRVPGWRIEEVVCLCSALFALHPIHTEPVSCIVGRSDLLSAAFYLSAALSYWQVGVKGTGFAARSGWLLLALALGFCAALSKELGVTVFGLMVSSEIVSALGSSNGGEREIDLKEVGKRLWNHFKGLRVGLTALLLLLAPMLVIKLHMSLHGTTAMYKWTILENDISLLPSAAHRVMSYGHVHCLYLYKLFWPFRLSYDYGWACISPVLAILDYRNVVTLGVYVIVLGFAFVGATRRNGVYLWSGAMLVVPFLPASNLFFPVGTVLGERLLYLPSMGFCLGLPVIALDVFGGGKGSGRGGRKKAKTKRSVWRWFVLLLLGTPLALKR